MQVGLWSGVVRDVVERMGGKKQRSTIEKRDI